MRIVSAVGPEARAGDRASLKRKKTKSPTARSLEECRRFEWPAQVVEKWIPQARRRVDLWNFGDIIAMDDFRGSLLIQCTTDSNASARVTKIREECKVLALAWLERGNRIQVWGWAKKGARGEVKRWTLRIIRITEQTLA